jgi:hypothetical protein
MIGAIILTGESNQETKIISIKNKETKLKMSSIPSFLIILDPSHFEGIIGNLLYFLIANIIIGLLFL